MKIHHFFDKDTFTLTYLVIDSKTHDVVIIDPVLNFDIATGNITDTSIFEVVQYIKSHALNVVAILETHVHADHLSGSQILKQLFPKAILAIGKRVTVVQKSFKNLFNLSDLKSDGSQFDYLFKDFEEVSFGSLKIKMIPTPGHTPACMSYLVGDAVFTGDALFMPDYGTGRCDFPNGSAHELYHSVSKNLYSLSDDTRVFVGHDYSPDGRPMQFQTSINISKKSNIHLNATTTEAEFVSFREARDKTLNAPRFLLPSIQVNINAGHLPKSEGNGISYLKLPLTIKSSILRDQKSFLAP